MPLIQTIRALALLIILMPAIACSSNISDKNMLKENVDAQQLDWITGRVVFNDFEGGFYGIITENGEKLLPMNMDKSLMRENNKVALKGKYEKDLMTTRQWGKPFIIIEIKLLEKGKGGSKNQSTH